MTDKAAVKDAEQYVQRLVDVQTSLGYGRPKNGNIQLAVGEAAQAVKALAALSPKH
jgi:hypothetical protein